MKSLKVFFILAVFSAFTFLTLSSMTNNTAHETGAYLEITLDIKAEDRPSAGAVYLKYKNPFLKQIKGATSKELLMRGEDVQVLHGFETEADAKAYLGSALFEKDVVRELKPYLQAGPEVRVYSVFKN